MILVPTMAAQNQILVISDPNTVNALQNFLAYNNYIQQYDNTKQVEEQYKKRPRQEESGEIPEYKSYDGQGQYLKSFTIKYDISGLDSLLKYMQNDLPIVYFFIQRKYDNFLPFVRGHTVPEIDRIFNNIYSDIKEITDNRFHLCPNMNECRFHECCKYIHPRDIDKLCYAFGQLQYYTNKYIDRMTEYHTSCVIRQLDILGSALWNVVSRKIRYHKS